MVTARGPSGDVLQPPGVFRDSSLRPGPAQRGLDERLEQRVAVARRRGELRVELAADEPRVTGELDHLAQLVARRHPAHLEARCLEARQVVVVDLVAVAMA